jgi:NTE family protein
MAYTNLVFEGGGVKGLAYVGALEAVEAAGIRPGVTGVAGTSAGAITAALVTLGYTAADLRQTLMALNLKSFEDGGLTGPVRVFAKFGFFKGDAFLQWMRGKVADACGGNGNATFADVNAHTGIDLRIVTCDLATHQAVVLSHRTTPMLPVALGVRMSMSIPLFFAAVRHAAGLYVDGGTMWNYPISIFDAAGPAAGVAAGARPSGTLGFHLGLLGSGPPTPEVIEAGNVGKYGEALYESLLSVQTFLFEQTPDDVARSVFIDDLGIRATDFGITDAQKEALIASGLKATTEYLAAHPG